MDGYRVHSIHLNTSSGNRSNRLKRLRHVLMIPFPHYDPMTQISNVTKNLTKCMELTSHTHHKKVEQSLLGSSAPLLMPGNKVLLSHSHPEYK